MTAHSTDDQRQTFLDAFARCGIVKTALLAAGCTRAQLARWRREDAFDAAYLEAQEDANDLLEGEARRRAFEGVVRERCLGAGDNARFIEELVYSDPLLLALLKANRPEKFAERTKSEITNPDGSLRPENATEGAARIAALLEEARRRRDASAIAEDDDLFN